MGQQMRATASARREDGRGACDAATRSQRTCDASETTTHEMLRPLQPNLQLPIGTAAPALGFQMVDQPAVLSPTSFSYEQRAEELREQMEVAEALGLSVAADPRAAP